MKNTSERGGSSIGSGPGAVDCIRVARASLRKDAIEDGIEASGLERWGCGDYSEGCGFLRECPVQLTADFDDGSGTVEFAGTISRTSFRGPGPSHAAGIGVCGTVRSIAPS